MRPRRCWWLALCLAAETAVLGPCVLLGPGAPDLSPLLGLGPLFACARLGAKGTAAAAVGALLLALVAGALPHGAPDAGFVLPVTVAVTGALCVRTARHRSARADELHQLTDVAQTVQQAVLRPIDTELGGIAVAARCHSVAQHALIGGDLYELAHTPFGLRVLLGDVRGHGLEAVRLAAATISAFRDLAYVTPALPTLVRELDARMSHQLDTEDFITVLLAEFAPGEVRLVNCGHHPPLRIGQRVEPLLPVHTSPPLGLCPHPVQQRAPLAPGQRLLLYTDALVEARNPGGAMFPLAENVRRTLTAPHLPDALQSLHDALLAHTEGPLSDDLALVLCEPAFQVPAAPGGPKPDHSRTDSHRTRKS